MNAELQNISAYMTRGAGLAFGTCEKPKPKNVLWIHDENPFADYVLPFDLAGNGQMFDFVRLWHFIRYSVHGIMFVMRKAIQLLKPGGFLLILEASDKDPAAKSYYNYQEMEGILMLFEDFIHIDARGMINDGKTYFYVCRKVGDIKVKEVKPLETQNNEADRKTEDSPAEAKALEVK
jgi:SAM-dependent methyltransferase